jgi:hypothetical protein
MVSASMTGIGMAIGDDLNTITVGIMTAIAIGANTTIVTGIAIGTDRVFPVLRTAF